MEDATEVEVQALLFARCAEVAEADPTEDQDELDVALALGVSMPKAAGVEGLLGECVLTKSGYSIHALVSYVIVHTWRFARHGSLFKGNGALFVLVPSTLFSLCCSTNFFLVNLVPPLWSAAIA